jgi:PhnB protein
MVKAIPDGYAGVTSTTSSSATRPRDRLLQKAFGATEVMRFPGPDGKIGHAELQDRRRQ